MNNLALIPARGGSKRIYRKNIKSFFNKPIISYSIEAAVKSKLFSEIMVSTDDLEIAEISRSYGAQIPFFRSSKSSHDFATTFDVVEEVINEYRKIGKEFQNICVIYPCAPFISKDILCSTYEEMIKNDYETIFPVIQFNKPVQRALRIENLHVKMVSPEFQNVRSQDLEPLYYDAGQFYWGKVEKVLQNRSLYSNNSGSVVLNEFSAHDIDTEDDWIIAELKFKLKNS
jgi:pseudaminic acid cytidylyltransferase